MPNEDEQVRIQLNTGMEWSSNNLFKLLLLLLLAAATGGDNNTADSRQQKDENRPCAVRRIVVNL